MAFVVARPGGRFEIRETAATDAGPRARTLATFQELSDGVMDHAEARASSPLDRARLRARAVALGAAQAPPTGATAAHELLTAHGRGEQLPPGTKAVLRHLLGERHDDADDEPIDHLLAMVPWLAASELDRAQALVDLLGVADAVPARPRGPLSYPQLITR